MITQKYDFVHVIAKVLMNLGTLVVYECTGMDVCRLCPCAGPERDSGPSSSDTAYETVQSPLVCAAQTGFVLQGIGLRLVCAASCAARNWFVP